MENKEEKVTLIVTTETYKDRELNKVLIKGAEISTTKERAKYLVEIKGYCEYKKTEKEKTK